MKITNILVTKSSIGTANKISLVIEFLQLYFESINFLHTKAGSPLKYPALQLQWCKTLFKLQHNRLRT